MRHRQLPARQRAFPGVILLGVLLVCVCTLALGQAGPAFGGRLSWVPISGAERNDVSGEGRASGELRARVLLVSGEFSGLPAPATGAFLRQGTAVGISGPVIGELAATAATSGMISGEVSLTRSQVDALQAGQLYVQLHAERGVAPDNAVLRGWLLAAE